MESSLGYILAISNCNKEAVFKKQDYSVQTVKSTL